jgi:uncharacterized protein YjiS (DUF1127 family)
VAAAAAAASGSRPMSPTHSACRWGRLRQGRAEVLNFGVRRASTV